MIFSDIRFNPDGPALAWQLLLERPAEANISHSVLPTPEEHAKFVANHPYRIWLAIDVDGVSVGAIYLSMRNEIGIAILEKHRRKGYASEAIESILNSYPPLPGEPGMRNRWYIANVSQNNVKSMKLFASLGAKLLNVTYQFGG